MLFVIFAVMVAVGAAVVLNQVSDWVFAVYGACTRWLSNRARAIRR